MLRITKLFTHLVSLMLSTQHPNKFPEDFANERMGFSLHSLNLDEKRKSDLLRAIPKQKLSFKINNTIQIFTCT